MTDKNTVLWSLCANSSLFFDRERVCAHIDDDDDENSDLEKHAAAAIARTSLRSPMSSRGIKDVVMTLKPNGPSKQNYRGCAPLNCSGISAPKVSA